MRTLLLFCLLNAGLPASHATTAKTATVHVWEVFQLTFVSNAEVVNPYLEMPSVKGKDLLTVTFTGTSGEAMNKSYKLTGFWKGGKEWVVNFSAPYSGTWKYVSTSADKSMNGKKGTFEALSWTEEEKKENPTRHGLVRVKKDGAGAGHFFEYADGQPFLWIGDTWWNWTNNKIKLETFKQLVDDRSAKGFTVGQLFVPGNGWGRPSSLLDETYSILDTAHANKVEQMIKYANSKGITVWIHGWWSRENMNTNIGEEKVQRWWRYLVHRFSAYSVIWVLAGEYNMYNYGGFPLDFWKNVGNMIKSDDPYGRITGVHNTPPFWDGGATAPQWGTGEVIHNEPWLDYNQSQVGHGKYANEMIPLVVSNEYNLNPAKPIVVTEPWYEFIEGNPTGMDIRFAAWSAILSGAAGHTYGGGRVWLASVPEAPGGGGTWPYEKGFERTTYDYEGAVSMKNLASFFKDKRYWEMSPHPELITEYPQPFCLANPGKEYIIYLRYSGTAKLRLDDDAATGEYQYQWFNPRTGKLYEMKNIKGNKILSFSCPESYPSVVDYKDWVLYVRKE
ncbi:MAG: DUF4038 domain-containing protein [Methanosarcina sp.]